jgi:hypothetical protein
MPATVHNTHYGDRIRVAGCNRPRTNGFQAMVVFHASNTELGCETRCLGNLPTRPDELAVAAVNSLSLQVSRNHNVGIVTARLRC